MSEGRLETAVLGLGEGGEVLLKAAGQNEDFRIQALADKDLNLAEKIAAQYQCTAYDDYRQMITAMDARLGADDVRCLLVADDIHRCDEYVRMAMKKGFNVLKFAPAARDFEEAAEFVRLADEEEVKFAVANPRRFAGSFVAFRELVQQGRIEQVFLITAFCSFEELAALSWQTDPKLAGGGVLLHNCYEMVDAIMWNFPLPQQVYSLSTNQAPDKRQRLYLTEDTAVVTMKFSDTLIGNLVASRRGGLGPRGEFLRIYGKDKVVMVSNTRLTVSDAEGKVAEEAEYDSDAEGKVAEDAAERQKDIKQRAEQLRKAKVAEEAEYDSDALECMAGVLKNFASGVLRPDEYELCSSGRENLKNMAVIESAYLSARTGMPEEPGRILQMAQFEPTDIQPESK